MELSIIPVVSTQSPLNNYRIKTCVNFIQNEIHIKSYNDIITDLYLLDKINKVITILNMMKNENIVYGTFQKSNHVNKYGIIMTLNKTIDIQKIYDQLKELELTVFGYNLLSDKNIVYLSSNNRLQNSYYNSIWHLSIDSFLQINPYTGQCIHQIVNELINKTQLKKYNFYGLGGEMGFIANFIWIIFKVIHV